MYRAKIWGQVPISTVGGFIPGMLQQWQMWPYSMHYWYFNLVNPHSNSVQSYILARAADDVKLNGEAVAAGDEHQYTTVLADFDNQETLVKTEFAHYTDRTIVTSKMQLEFTQDRVDLILNGHEHTFHDLSLPNCYLADRLGAYSWFNMLAKNRDWYFMAQNVIARGPLVPWIWLHFYFNNGELATTFIPAGQGHTLQLGERKLHIDRIEQTDAHFVLYASAGDAYFNLALNKHYDAQMIYDPSWSPAWEYNQIHVSLNRMQTNLPGYRSATKGTGILEIAKGFAL